MKEIRVVIFNRTHDKEYSIDGGYTAKEILMVKTSYDNKMKPTMKMPAWPYKIGKGEL